MALKKYIKDVIHMKKAIKKLVSIAMAFTLLVTGTAITKSVNTLEAHALTPPIARENCHNHGQYTFSRYYYTASGRYYLGEYCYACLCQV